MAYGEIKVDTITFTDGGIDKSISISGLVQNPTFSGNITVTGTISGNLVQGQTVSGDTVTGTTAAFTTGTFISLTGTTIQGTTATYTTGSFTSLTGTTTTGTTANFVSGVYTTQLSGATITGNAAAFTTVTGKTATITSGVFASGTAAAPSVSVGATNNGIYSPSANNVAISTSGTGRLFVDASGRVGVGTSSPTQLLDLESGTGARIAFTDAGTRRWSIGTPAGGSTGFSIHDESGSSEVLRITSAGNVGVGTTSPTGTLQIQPTNSNTPASALVVRQNNGTDTSQNTFSIENDPVNNVSRLISTGTTSPQMSFYTGASERARIDSSGRLLVGASTSTALLGYNSGVQLATADGTFSAIRNTANTGSPEFVSAKSRGSTGSPSAVLDGDGLWLGRFAGYDGTSYIEAARISAVVDGTPGANDMPGRLVFSVTADGASSPTEAMRIKNSLIINFANAPTYADNTAALAGGLVAGDVYRQSDGTLMITY